MSEQAVSVRQLNSYVKALVESDRRLQFITVRGEISNFKNHYSSGHWYFTLKDADASVRCVMFRSSAARVKFSPDDGDMVTVTGRVSLYEKDGQYQFYAEEMQKGGAGDLAAQFNAIKEKLEKEGLFAAENKRPIVKFPKKIAVITSDTGAAVEDIKNILSRRYPVCKIVMCPVQVQGESAVDSMIDALDKVYSLNGIDTVIIGRGGGSAEDLQAFNNEKLARKIYESPFPVISAVGHETDFTICDFVADLRAPTPSAAAELAVPDGRKLLENISNLKSGMLSSLRQRYENAYLRYKSAVNSAVFSAPESFVDLKYQSVDKCREILENSCDKIIAESETKLSGLITQLEALSPLKTMLRGYSVALKNNKAVTDSADLAVGDKLEVKFAKGKAKCTVCEV